MFGSIPLSLAHLETVSTEVSDQILSCEIEFGAGVADVDLRTNRDLTAIVKTRAKNGKEAQGGGRHCGKLEYSS